jgi:CBS domain-containing protein
MIIGGIYWTFTGNIISGLWLVFIGWFLNNAAESGFRQMLVQKTISGVRVRDMMTGQVETVSADLTIQELIDRYILPHNLRARPVVENEQIIGIVTLEDIRHVPPDDWGMIRIRQAMTPREKLLVLKPNDPVSKALEILGQNDINQLPVVENEMVVGLVTRGQIIRFLQVREELGLRK